PPKASAYIGAKNGRCPPKAKITPSNCVGRASFPCAQIGPSLLRDCFTPENGRRSRRDPCHSDPLTAVGSCSVFFSGTTSLHLRFLLPAICENDGPSFASRQHELRRRHVARIQSMGR